MKDDEALEKFKLDNNISKFQVSRLKGLGEMSPEETEEALIDPDTRIIKQVTVSDYEQADKLFEDLMGTKVEPRREYIAKNSERAEVYV